MVQDGFGFSADEQFVTFRGGVNQVLGIIENSSLYFSISLSLFISINTFLRCKLYFGMAWLCFWS
jgi:hypothetical protein